MRGVFGGSGEGFFGYGFCGLLGGLPGEAIFSTFQLTVVNPLENVRPGAIWGVSGGGNFHYFKGSPGGVPGELPGPSRGVGFKGTFQGPFFDILVRASRAKTS